MNTSQVQGLGHSTPYYNIPDTAEFKLVSVLHNLNPEVANYAKRLYDKGYKHIEVQRDIGNLLIAAILLRGE